MKKITGYLKDYILWIDRRIFFITFLFTALAIFINYRFGLSNNINELNEVKQFISWYFVFLIAFLFPYFLQLLFKKHTAFSNKKFIAILLIAPTIFAWKMYFTIEINWFDNEVENTYWQRVIYWPAKLIVVTAMIFIVWRIFDRDKNLYGLKSKDFNYEPYFLMLLLMMPLVAAASTQPDFLAMYPKLKNVAFLSEGKNAGLYKLLYELSYGSDFFTIELFFRGFLIIAFARFAGKDAILPMAVFYCTIHFGKPLGECISSFFGGLILGTVTYHTRNIYGGLIVHLGIAWMMELGGYLGSLYFK